MPLSYRDVTPDDLDDINRLHESVWFPSRSRAGWLWLMTGNPDQGKLSPGRVAVHEDHGIVGFIGNHGVRLVGGDETYGAATGYSMLAQPGFAGAGVRLLGSLLRQEGTFGLFTLNNNKLAEKVYPRFQGEPLFEQTARLQLQWITNPLLYVAGGMRRRVHAMRGYSTSKHRERFSPPPRTAASFGQVAPHVVRLDPAAIDGAGLADFWNRLRTDGRIHANRDLAALTWRLSNPDQSHPPLVLAYDRGDGVEGLLIAMVTKESEIAPPSLTIMDLCAPAPAERDALPALVRVALDVARRQKLARTILPYLNPGTLAALGDLGAERHQHAGHIHAHVKFDRTAPRDAILASWAPTPWDGDFSFCVRQPPVSA